LGGAWTLVAKTSGVNGIAGIDALMSNVNTAGVAHQPGIGATTYNGNPFVGTFGGAVALAYFQNLSTPANVMPLVGRGAGTPGNLPHDMNDPAWDNAARIATGTFGAIRPAFTTVGPQSTDGNVFGSASAPYSVIDAAVTTVVRDIIVGDYNRDGDFDAADYVVWRKTLYAMGPGLPADGSVNSVVDAADYNLWRRGFGMTGWWQRAGDRRWIGNKGGRSRAGIGRVEFLDMQMSNTSELFVELIGTGLNQFDRLVASGDVNVDGYLNIDIDEISPGVPFVPALGQTFNIITGNSVTGEFDFADVSGMPAGLAFHIEYLANAVQLQVVTKPIFSADFDEDGDVDMTDLAIWDGAYDLNQLGDADGDSDGADVLIWQRQFGSAPGAGSGAVAESNVPEPALLPLLLLSFSSLAAAARRR
jgi:hypothetical protein